MNSKPITHAQARAWMRSHFAGFSIPRGSQCWFVSGVQCPKTRGNLYLVAGADGLEGIFIVKAKREGKIAA